MKPIEIPTAIKKPGRELTESVYITLQVDRAFLPQIIHWTAIPVGAPVKITIERITDPEQAEQEDADKAEGERRSSKKLTYEAKKGSDRYKQYWRIVGLCDQIGLNEAQMRERFRELTGHESRTEMTQDQLDEVEKWLKDELWDIQHPGGENAEDAS